MEAQLLGQFTCPLIDESIGPPSELTISTVASLLYFDQVHTLAAFRPVGFGSTGPHGEMLEQAVKHFFERAGSESSIELDPNDLPPETPCRDALWALYLRCLPGLGRDLKTFLDGFGPLITEEVLNVNVWHENIKLQRGVDEANRVMRGNVRLAMHLCFPKVEELAREDEMRKVDFDSDSYLYLIPELIDIFDAWDERFLDSTDPGIFRNMRVLAVLVDLILTWTGCSRFGRSITCRPHQQNLLKNLSKDGLLEPDDRKPSGGETAAKLTATVLRHVPLIMPRSAHALLEVRRLLADDLGEFRMSLRDIANDLSYAKGEGITDYDIEHEVDVRILRPLRQLEKRLERPGVEIAKNLVSTSSFLTQAVTFGIAMMTDMGAIAAPLLALGTGLFAAAFQAKTKREGAIRDSGLAFIIRAKARNR